MPHGGRSDAHVQPAAQPLFQPDEAAFITSFLDNPPSAFDAGLDLFSEVPHNYEWLLSENPPSLRDVSTGPPTTRPHFSHSYSTGHHPLSVQTDLGHFQQGHSHPMSAPVAHHEMMSAGAQMMPQSARPADHFTHQQQLQHAHHSHMSPPVRTSRTQSVSVPSQGSHAPVFPTAATTAAALQDALKHRRKTSDGVSDRLIFNLTPFEDENGMRSAGLGGTFDEAMKQQMLQQQHPGQQHLQQPPRPMHIRAHSESHAAFGEDPDPRRLYRFGSDRHFSATGFVRNEHEPSEGQLTQQLLDNNYGAIGGGAISSEQSRTGSPLSAMRKRRADDGVTDDSDLDSPAKRQRMIGAGGEMPMMSARRISASKEWRRRASTAASLGGPLSPSIKRRRSSPPLPGTADSSNGSNSAKKPPRENLTEEQKRNNHIISEQKRRNLIKQGFEELNIIVPALREGGFSKSNVLIETAQHLENIIKGNDELREQLASFGLS